jgi:hypothetical protein
MIEAAARLSRRTDNLTASPIREILAVIGRPGMISFAGGLPAAETFPDFDAGAVPPLQYGPEGEPRERTRHLRSIGLTARRSASSSAAAGDRLAAKLRRRRHAGGGRVADLSRGAAGVPLLRRAWSRLDPRRPDASPRRRRCCTRS